MTEPSIDTNEQFNDCMGFAVAAAHVDRELRAAVQQVEMRMIDLDLPDDVRGHIGFLLGAVQSVAAQEAARRWGKRGKHVVCTIVEFYRYAEEEKKAKSSVP